MNELDVETLKQLMAAEHVTPLPWVVSDTDNGCAVHDPEGLTLAYRFPILTCQSPDDLRLVVALRNAAPAIIAALEDCKGLRAEIAELKESLDACMEDAGG